MLISSLVLHIVDPLLRIGVARSLEFGQEARAPKRVAGILNADVNILAALDEVEEVLVAVDVAGDVLDCLRKEDLVSYVEDHVMKTTYLEGKGLEWVARDAALDSCG